MHLSRITIILGLILFLALPVFAGGGAEDTASGAADELLLNQVKERGSLIVGTMGTYPPYNFLNENEEMDGFDADIAREVASRLDLEAEFVPTEWSGMIEGLLRGRFDLVVSQMTITPERAERMFFTEPYITNEVKIIVQESNDSISVKEDLAGTKVGVGLGTNDEAYLRTKLRPEIGDFEILTYNDVITSLMDLDQGRIDATINNIYAISPLVERQGLRIKAVGEPIKADNAGIALRKDEESRALAEAVDAALADMKADGSYQAIFDKWFGQYQ